MGDSSGGNLAPGVIHQAMRSGKYPHIDMQVLAYPVLDHMMSTPSYRGHGKKYLISAHDMAWFWDCYVPDVEQRTDERVTPAMTRYITFHACVTKAEFVDDGWTVTDSLGNPCLADSV